MEAKALKKSLLIVKREINKVLKAMEDNPEIFEDINFVRFSY